MTLDPLRTLKRHFYHGRRPYRSGDSWWIGEPNPMDTGGKKPTEKWWFRIPPLPKALYRQLKVYETQTGLTSHQVVIAALAQFLNGGNVPAPSQVPGVNEAPPTPPASTYPGLERWTVQGIGDEYVILTRDGRTLTVPRPQQHQPVFHGQEVWIAPQEPAPDHPDHGGPPPTP